MKHPSTRTFPKGISKKRRSRKWRLTNRLGYSFEPSLLKMGIVILFREEKRSFDLVYKRVISVLELIYPDNGQMTEKEENKSVMIEIA